MWYARLADFVVVIHIAYVAYIIVGLGLILVGWQRRWPWVRNLWFRLTHLVAILIVVLELILQTTCPLTMLELNLRSWAGQPVTATPFVDRLMHFVLLGWLPGAVTNSTYVLVALVIAVTFVLAPPRWHRRPQSSRTVMGLEQR
ncbi:MAG: DUF2784 domain-containing protein [Pyrinomonadaceae bacterium]